MTTFLLIRHAATDSVGQRLSGRTAGVHLNEAGRAQAQALAARLKDMPITAVYCSPLERAVETAAPIAAIFDIQPVINAYFLEIDFGAWTNRAFAELQESAHFQAFNAFRSHTRVPGGESMLEAQTRIITGMEQLCQQHPQETIAIISHADIIKAALAYYAGIHLDLMQRIEISPASVSILTIYNDTARILLINDTGQLNNSG
ncbi:MAG: histidine phosphatase family protein [Saprospiraceae bacterium]